MVKRSLKPSRVRISCNQVIRYNIQNHKTLLIHLIIRGKIKGKRTPGKRKLSCLKNLSGSDKTEVALNWFMKVYDNNV